MKVRDIFYSLTLKVNPKIKESGVVFTKTSVGYSDGDRFTAQRLLDVYNEGRFTLVNALKFGSPDNLLAYELALAVKRADVYFNYVSTNYAEATYPGDSVKIIALANAYNHPITILPNSYLPTVMDDLNPHFQNTSLKTFVFVQGQKFVYYGTYIDAAAPYWCTYYGVSAWELPDVTGGLTEEIFFDDMIPLLMQVCEAIANEEGATEVNNLARILVQQRKGGR